MSLTKVTVENETHFVPNEPFPLNLNVFDLMNEKYTKRPGLLRLNVHFVTTKNILPICNTACTVSKYCTFL
jgi:hypothetical protein